MKIRIFVCCALFVLMSFCREAKAGRRNSEGPVNITKDGGSINVESAPEDAILHTGGGNIHIGSAGGNVDASTGGGSIKLDSVRGTVKATTGRGNITVRITGDAANVGHDVNLTSAGGDITLILPLNASATVDIRLSYTKRNPLFHIESDFKLYRDETKDWSSAEGTPRKYIYGKGTIAGGANKISISTVNGNVYLKKY